MTDNEIANEIRKYKLSPCMIEMLTYSPLDATFPLEGGPTRAALIRRGLAWKFGTGQGGRLTEAGRELALKLRARP